MSNQINDDAAEQFKHHRNETKNLATTRIYIGNEIETISPTIWETVGESGDDDGFGGG